MEKLLRDHQDVVLAAFALFCVGFVIAMFSWEARTMTSAIGKSFSVGSEAPTGPAIDFEEVERVLKEE